MYMYIIVLKISKTENMIVLTTERTFDSQDTQVIGMFDLLFWPMDDCTTRHWQMSSRSELLYNYYFLQSFFFAVLALPTIAPKFHPSKKYLHSNEYVV